MRLNPCHGCPARDGCERRDELRERVRGLGARSVTFRCSRLADALRPGRRIHVSMPRLRNRYPNSYEPDFRVEHIAVPATITGHNGDYKFTCVTDPGTATAREDDPDAESGVNVEKYRFRRYMRHTRIIRFLDEPDKALCNNGRVLLAGGTCDRPPDEPCDCETNAALSKMMEER